MYIYYLIKIIIILWECMETLSEFNTLRVLVTVYILSNGSIKQEMRNSRRALKKKDFIKKCQTKI